jgi:hypothetical protein
MIDEFNRINPIVSSTAPTRRRIGMTETNLASIDQRHRTFALRAANNNDVINGLWSACVYSQRQPRLARGHRRAQKRRANAFDLAKIIRFEAPLAGGRASAPGQESHRGCNGDGTEHKHLTRPKISDRW